MAGIFTAIERLLRTVRPLLFLALSRIFCGMRLELQALADIRIRILSTSGGS